MGAISGIATGAVMAVVYPTVGEVRGPPALPSLELPQPAPPQQVSMGAASTATARVVPAVVSLPVGYNKYGI